MSLFKGLLSSLKIRKWPSKLQWRQFFKVLTTAERIIFFVCLIGSFASLAYLLSSFYLSRTAIAPANGGIHIEGIVGQPRFINPIYANSDIDRDLVQLIFSGLMKYDGNLEIVNDLAERYEIEEDGKVYKFYLKENLFWQDKIPLTADDVIFTIKTIQNPDYKSPLRASWVGVEAEKINSRTIKFSLKQPYAAFVENCTFKILPEHIWKSSAPQNFPFEIYNLKPIGSGPYKLKDILPDKKNRIEYLTLTKNPLYSGPKTHISEIKFLFFDTEENLIKAAKRKKITGLSLGSPQELGKEWKTNYFSLPRYFAVFFNPNKSEVLGDAKVRTALNYGVDKVEIAKNVLNPILPPEQEIADSPIIPRIYGFNPPTANYEYDPEKAKKLLEDAGYKEINQDGFREKNVKKELAFQFRSDLRLTSEGNEVKELQKCLTNIPGVYPNGEISGRFDQKTKDAVAAFQEMYANEILKPSGLTKGTGQVGGATRTQLNKICFGSGEAKQVLEFSLTTVDQPQLVAIAETLKQQWKTLGISVDIKKYPVAQLEQDFVKTRNYESLLFGEVLGAIPDLFPFWHSSQIKDPGLNLAIYENKDVDKLLEESRKSLDPAIRAEKLEQMQDILLKDAPVVFLLNPEYIYFTSDKIKGLQPQKISDPSKRFSDIEKWYIKTKRVWR